MDVAAMIITMPRWTIMKGGVSRQASRAWVVERCMLRRRGVVTCFSAGPRSSPQGRHRNPNEPVPARISTPVS
jgi:hypothetical protein